MNVIKRLTKLIGNTPVIQLERISSNIFAKLESRNPGGSVKDRAVFFMLKDALESGAATRNTVIVESNSSNTGISLAWICASLDLKLILTIPENTPQERRKMLAAYGAEIILTPAAQGLRGAMNKAKEIRENDNGYSLNQFSNKANVKAQYFMAQELYNQMTRENFAIDIFVAGVGSGGTVTGCAQFLKEKLPDVKIFAVEPEESRVLQGGKHNQHKIQGIGAGFVPEILDLSLIDEVISVSEKEAEQASSLLAKKEGLLQGISSGAALSAAMSVSEREEYRRKNIAVVFPDAGERYLNTDLFD